MGTKLHEFHMSKDSVRYIFKSGKIAVFDGGIYRTTSEAEMKELKEEITAGIGAIWQVAGAEIVDSDDIDPVAVFKRKIITEYEAEKARSLNNGQSFSDTTPSKPHGSGTVGVAGAVSNSGAAAVVPGSIRVGSK
jgi:hypothetical protein